MEKLTTLREKSAWANNQTTLNKIGEDNGQLTFDGKPVGGATVTRPTNQKVITKNDGTIELSYDGDVVYGFFWDEDTDIPAETEIADVELIVDTVNTDFFSIKDWLKIDNSPAISMVDKVVFFESFSYVFLAMFCPLASNIGSAIRIGRDYTVRITYYTD